MKKSIYVFKFYKHSNKYKVKHWWSFIAFRKHDFLKYFNVHDVSCPLSSKSTTPKYSSKEALWWH